MIRKTWAGAKYVLGTQIEQKLTIHIKELQAAAFRSTMNQVRIRVYKHALRYKLKHNFKSDKMMDWF